MKDLEKIKEFFLKDRAMTAAYEGNTEYFKPVIRKDKNSPSILYVDIAYPEGSGVLSIGGSKTMSGQDRETGAEKAMKEGEKIRQILISKFNLEDHDVNDLKNGKVQVFAISSDFDKMTTDNFKEIISPSLNEATGESLYKDWDQFEKPSKIKVYLNNGKTLEISPLKLKGGKRVYDAILQAFIDDRFDITNKVIQGMMNNLSEAKKEDKVDTITMDVPLFIRMLEYSREDAAEDMDLHDVTEKAISLGKERGILQMDDYDEIIGTTEKVNEVNLKQSKLSSAEYQKAKKLKDFKASNWKWNADEDLYTKVNEGELTEAYVPSNIKEFAKRKGVSSLVNKVAGWAEKVGKGIRGGTAVGYNYSTLVLDMTYQGSEIRINTDNDTVTLYDEPVRSFGEFQRVYADGEGNNLEERIHETLNKINEELCPAGKAYIKRRQAAGEKSSAYLSGRGVKVCKGQMSGKAKKK